MPLKNPIAAEQSGTESHGIFKAAPQNAVAVETPNSREFRKHTALLCIRLTKRNQIAVLLIRNHLEVVATRNVSRVFPLRNGGVPL